MARTDETFTLVRHTLQVRRLTVTRVEDLSRTMRRVTLGGPELRGFRSLAPEDHVKLFFPAAGESEPVVPSLTPMGRLAQIARRPIGRDYTPRRFSDRELVVDFFLHGGGVASTWAGQVSEGMCVGVGGPRGSFVLKNSYDWHLFIGDETAHPEFARRLEELPVGVSTVVIALTSAGSGHYPFPGRASSRVTWVDREGRDASQLLADEVRRLVFPRGSGFAWLAGEAAEVRAVYTCLIRERGLRPQQIRASGHWKRGCANHDHHEPILLDAGR
jgi:NADPH-dependent ferric siderophore reductase